MAERFRPSDRGFSPNVLVLTFLQGRPYRQNWHKTDTTVSTLKRKENNKSKQKINKGKQANKNNELPS